MMSQQTEPIAIVGSGCRFPGGATSPSALWRLLQEPRDVVQELPADRFDNTGFYHENSQHHGTSNVRHAYLLEQDLRVFDAQFFFISPNEADSIDPQQRLLMETVYEALEAGGHSLHALRGSDTAVYVGTMGVDWNDMALRDLDTIPTYFATGTNRAIISNRVSYFFDWHGPSMTIDTACSSSLIAVHQGVQALRSGESRVAVACGTQVILGPETFIIESKMKMLSPTGHSRMWDAGADGYARGEGVAAVVMKRLSDAIADGDHIQCLIRDTGTNQDGNTNGLTVPSSTAQAALIRKTYAKAGLDLNNIRDRPQYFEAHGTGTQAGDPREARAIFECFSKDRPAEAVATPLYVGSVKTVIGHTEGAAGLAGLLKAAESIQQGQIAPNLFFEKLNPSVEPFYHHIQVPTSLTPWPELPEGVPRRASVNSFGFGGSNAHAILEQYVPAAPRVEAGHPSPSIAVTPFVFSAASEVSLVAQLKVYAEHLKKFQHINPQDLASTLYDRRTHLAAKAAFSANTIPELASKLDEKLAAAKQNGPFGIRSVASGTDTAILGVFTGQGAQWAAMGADLIKTWPGVASRRVQELEDSLASLPVADRPKWSLREEMLAGAETSRLSEAELSQPLCTAIQIVLVDLLAIAGITFSAVVGHSSGEIAAAYAAGFLSSQDAIRVAYYRGLYARLAGASTDNGHTSVTESGAMLAVGTSIEDARELTSLSSFKGRLAIAAHNSSASVTLSGDVSAILLAKKVFDEEKKFARLLKVDTAYHSHHMTPCGDPYVDALKHCGVHVRSEGRDDCTWYSSVSPDAQGMRASAELEGIYWRDNMAKTVLFADAITNAVESNPQLNLALEIGPHPALKGPATQTIADVRATGLPYHGVLSRGSNDITAFSEALGFIWTQLGPQSTNLEAYQRALVEAPESDSRAKLVTGLPSYQWNHSRRHWHESRRSAKLLGRKKPFHELLGYLSPESTSHDMRWKNILKPSEIGWLEGHQLQGQIVFPAAGYIAMAFEAAKLLVTASTATAELFELHDLNIPKAIAFDDGDQSAVETLVTMTNVRHNGAKITGDFCCYSCPVSNANSTSDTTEMELMASCTIEVILGSARASALSSPPIPDMSNMVDVGLDRFYSSLIELGYGYSGPFRTMSSLKRRLGLSAVQVSTFPYGDKSSVYLVHPALLDVAFQAAFLAYAAPGDGRMWSLHVPTAIGRIRLNPELSNQLPLGGCNVPVWSTATSGNGAQEPLKVSIDILGHESSTITNSMIQVEDLVMKPFAPATAADDRALFSSTKWQVADPEGALAVEGISPPASQVELARICERVAFYYLRMWKAELTDEEWAKGQAHFQHLRNYMNHILATVASGHHPTVKSEWSNDTSKDISALVESHPNVVDLQLLSAVGKNMVAAVRGETVMIEHMIADNMLDDFYAYGVGLAQLNVTAAAMMKQITHRYPHARILEIGAGTGGATKTILGSIGSTMSSYTYTDISTGFFDKAAEIFAAYSDRMTFKVLDADRSPDSQGFVPHSYDIVVASNVLHATPVLQRTLENTRKLLKPGGWLVLAELTDKNPIRYGTIMSSFEGWWLGVDDGRKYTPVLTPREWHNVLRKTGFGGVDAVTPELDSHATWPYSIIAAQAVDERVSLLRRPLLSTPSASSPMYHNNIVILGTQSLESARIAEELAEHLSRFTSNITILDGLPTEEEAQTLEPMSSFINLVDIDEPIFKNITAARMEGLKRVFELAQNVLWVTHGAVSAENPYHMASVAFRRVMSNEYRHICLHNLDVEDLESDKVSKTIAAHLLRQSALDEWEREAPTTDKIRRHGFLWSREPEIFLDKRGREQIPRLLYNTAQNARLNSSRRTITRSIPATALENTSLSWFDTGAALVEQAVATRRTTEARVSVQSSTLMALSIDEADFLFLGIGREASGAKKQQPVIFLTRKNAYLATPVVSTPIAEIDDDDAALLNAVANELLTESVLRAVPAGSSLVIHSISSAKHATLAAALLRQAEAKAVQVVFISSTASAVDDVGSHSIGSEIEWTKLDQRAPKHVLKSLLPTKATHFLDLTAESTSQSAGDLIACLLPKHVKSIAMDDLVRVESQITSLDRDHTLLSKLQVALVAAQEAPRSLASETLITTVDQVHEKRQACLTEVMRWSPSVSGQISVEIRPHDAQQLFEANKTYLLIGLTGEIGRSLCEWMVANGARCVCLASRTPKTNQSWLQSFEGTGAIVKTYAVDVTDKVSLARLVTDIRAQCPPIAGVANGAMILRDSLFNNMSIDMMQAVLRPKIEGSSHLDELFHNDPLDFFILFSSSTALIGNPGQSSYVIANGFLNGLVRQRRRRGLAASAVDIGRVAGLGYVETAGETVLNQLISFGLMPISETEFHQVFAETILAGYPTPAAKNVPSYISHADAIVTTGLRTIRDDEDVRGPFFDNPLFSHCIIETNGLASSGGEGSDNKMNNNVPIVDQLATVSNEEDALEVLRSSFAVKLCSIFQITGDTLDPTTPLVELGMDSLVAVEARSWFLKNLKVDIPVLKLVGGSSLSDICEMAFKKLPEELTAKIGTAESKPVQALKPPAKAEPPIIASEVSSSSASSNGDRTMESEIGQTTATSISSATEASVVLPSKDIGKSITGGTTVELSPQVFLKSEPISIAQSRFWFLRLLVEDPTTFNVTLRYRMTGHVRFDDLEKALRIVTVRHESLRSCFIADEHEADKAFQKILARSPVRLERKTVQSAEEAIAEYNTLRRHEFDLSSGSLFKMILLTLTPTCHYLLVNAHHMIMDVTSFQILLSDMDKAYNGEHLGSRPRQYPEFSVIQRQMIEDGKLDRELKYWQSIFPSKSPPPVLPLLPMARSNSRTAIANYEVYQVHTKLEPSLAARVRLIARGQRSTPFHFYLAAFKAMLFSFTDVEDITIGIADANRNDSDLMGSIGFFMNLLTLRFRRETTQTFTDSVIEARNIAHAALEHSRLPFDILLKELKVTRSSSYNPFFQAFFDYRQQDRGREVWAKCEFEVEDYHPGRSGYDISLDVADIAGEANVALRVQKSFYDETAANLLLETYTHFVAMLSQDTSLTLQSMSLYSDEQLNRGLEVGLGPYMVSEWPETLVHRIDMMAVDNPEKIALRDGLGNELTYRSMLRRVQAIAEVLIESGTAPGSRVLVFQQAATDWICSMLAIMRIGGIYVPLDLRNPLSRLIMLSKDCQPSAVIADQTTITDASELEVPVVINTATVSNAPLSPVANVARADKPAAILYTSGSTGNPKGILIRHSGIRNEMEGYTKTYRLGAERVLQQSAFTFDFSVDQIFTGLVNGGMVYLVPWSKRGDPVSITEIMREEAITYTKVTPSEYSMWLEFGFDNLCHASNWKFAFAGGESLSNHVLQQFARLGLPELRLHNSYGPAEISIASHKGLVDYDSTRSEEDGLIPCGFSLPNYATYVLDEHLKPLPIGMPGEVVIGGAGVSFGYLTDQTLTSKSFVTNPYANADHLANGWDRMYRTGDIGHLQHDGSLVFRHRVAGDTQVKLRGLRIDLRDIESNLISGSGGVLKDAVVTLRRGDSDYLVAHVVFQRQHTIDNPNAFLEQLLGRLPIPQYMVPAVAIPVESFPLNNHSKVDRKALQALPLPHRVAVDTQSDIELTDTMIQLRQLWREVLGKGSDDIGIKITATTNFFMVGGNSLLIVRLQSRIRQVLDVTIRLVDLISSNTLDLMARKIEESASIGLIDWEEETQPPALPSSNRPSNEVVQPKAFVTVLVTGATGNLARRILPMLVTNALVRKVHCVAVREQGPASTRAVLHSDKITQHRGDLAAPRLGLSEEDWDALSGEVDVILHLGAVRSFWDNYHMIRLTNVCSTKELVRLAGPRRIPIHFVSTSGVLPRGILESATTTMTTSSAATYKPPTDGSEGYCASKWASECLLERSSTSLGVPSFVYRFFPTGSAKQLEHHKQHVLDEFVRCVDLTGVMPDYAGWEGHVDVISGEVVASSLCDSLVYSARTTEHDASPKTAFEHYESTVSIGVNDLRTHLEQMRGQRGLERLHLLKWMGRIKAAGFSYVLASLETTVRDDKGEETLVSRR